MIEKASNNSTFNLIINVAINERFNELLVEIAASKRDEDRISFLEDVISVDACLSLLYATIIDKPFPKGENAIAENAWTACNYASTVLKKRFPSGENAIIKSRRSKSLEKLAFKTYMTMLNSRDPIYALAEDAQLGKFPPARHSKKMKG